MPLVLADRVRETTTTTGTGTVTLGGAVTGFQTFAAIGNGNTTYYAIAGQGTNEWEVGIGTYTSAGTTLSRDTVLESSNAGALVNFSAGTKDVFCDYPADRAVYLDTATNATLPGLTVSANSSTNAVRITQTGTGNALVVEDSANPDSTPFVIDASGRVIEGYTTATTVLDPGGTLRTPQVQVHGLTTSAAGEAITNWATSASSYSVLYLSKSKSGVVGTQGVVASGDSIGDIQFSGDDGTNFVPAARIFASVDGTPGTNDMPGRLVFSTTADGASSPTERMRISSAGGITIGGGTVSNVYRVRVNGTLTGGTSAYGFSPEVTVASDVTSNAIGFHSSIGTDAAAFTLNLLRHFNARQGTIGAGSAVTTQAGFYADSTLTGATNNYGFYSNIASGTGRWNFYANGDASNYFAGDVGVGTTSPSAPGGTRNFVVNSAGTTIVKSTGSTAARFDWSTATANSYVIAALQDNAGSPYWQLSSGPALTVAYYDMPVHVWRSQAAVERMRIDSSGNVGIGTSSPTYKLDVVGTADATTLRASNGIIVNSATITENYTIASGDNGLSAGPITVASGIAVTVSSGSVWTVV